MSREVLTKAGIVEAVQQKMGLSKKVTAEVVEDLLDIVKDCLVKGESIKISGFGNFEVREKNARRGRNPKSGEEIVIPARRVLTFKPSQVLKKTLNDR